MTTKVKCAFCEFKADPGFMGYQLMDIKNNFEHTFYCDSFCLFSAAQKLEGI